jgi:hypothetical protein
VFIFNVRARPDFVKFSAPGGRVPVEQQPPQILALILADQVYQDDSSGRFSILGIRSALGARIFPWKQTQLAVYAVLTDGRGKTTVRLRLIDVEGTREPVLEYETIAEFLDPTDDVQVIFHLRDLVFPEPGDYRLQVEAAGQLLCERRLLLIPLENPGQP